MRSSFCKQLKACPKAWLLRFSCGRAILDHAHILGSLALLFNICMGYWCTHFTTNSGIHCLCETEQHLFSVHYAFCGSPRRGVRASIRHAWLLACLFTCLAISVLLFLPASLSIRRTPLLCHGPTLPRCSWPETGKLAAL